MKTKVLLGSLAWLIVITVLHVQLNVGWRELVRQTRTLFGWQRSELVVGFLPVT